MPAGRSLAVEPEGQARRAGRRVSRRLLGPPRLERPLREHARHTERQAQQQAAAGARYSYTPQVLVNGRDWRRWPELPAPASNATVRLSMQRVGEQVELQVQPLR